MGNSLRGVFADLVPANRVAVVPNGTPDLSPRMRDSNTEIVLFLSHFRRRKGVVESVEAALRVLETRPNTRFLFAGEWEDRDLERELQERARAGGDGIRFLPLVTGETKRNLLLSASVFLFPPTRPEGHPRAVLEALSAGLPVVTVAQGAIGETVIDGECGFVLDDPTPEVLAQRLLQLLRDDDLRLRMGRAARARYLECYTQERADRELAEWLVRIAPSRDVAHSIELDPIDSR
jgi:glycosyltransferase involved in cell wall biosynthesis